MLPLGELVDAYANIPATMGELALVHHNPDMVGEGALGVKHQGIPFLGHIRERALILPPPDFLHQATSPGKIRVKMHAALGVHVLHEDPTVILRSVRLPEALQGQVADTGERLLKRR